MLYDVGQPVVISFFSDSFLYSLHCTEVCGLYTTNDVTMDNVQADCKAFEANTSCPDKELRIEKLKLLTRKASKPLIKTISLQPGQSYDPVQEFTRTSRSSVPRVMDLVDPARRMHGWIGVTYKLIRVFKNI